MLVNAAKSYFFGPVKLAVKIALVLALFLIVGFIYLAATLDLPATRVSQHLALLRAQRLVEERRDGRNHFYRLAQPFIAEWILQALPLVDIRTRLEEAEHIDAARALWSAAGPNPSH